MYSTLHVRKWNSRTGTTKPRKCKLWLNPQCVTNRCVQIWDTRTTPSKNNMTLSVWGSLLYDTKQNRFFGSPYMCDYCYKGYISQAYHKCKYFCNIRLFEDCHRLTCLLCMCLRTNKIMSERIREPCLYWNSCKMHLVLKGNILFNLPPRTLFWHCVK